MKKLVSLLILLHCCICFANKSFYDIKMKTITGDDIDFSKFRGKPVLIANVASKCGYTDKGYEDLNHYHHEYARYDLVVIAVPCNQFGFQEPDPEATIRTFVRVEKQAQFILTEKVNVNGDHAHDLYRFLKGEFLPETHELRHTFPEDIGWNFEYFLVDRRGLVSHRWLSGTDMQRTGIEDYIASEVWVTPTRAKEL